MVPTLHIDKFQSGLYTATLEEGGQPMFEESMFSSVADAILHFGKDAPDDLIQFIDIRYSGYGIGTVSTTRMKAESEVLAKDLMSLYSAILRSEESMELARRGQEYC